MAGTKPGHDGEADWFVFGISLSTRCRIISHRRLPHSPVTETIVVKRDTQEVTMIDQEIFAAQIEAGRFPFPSEGDITLAVRRARGNSRFRARLSCMVELYACHTAGHLRWISAMNRPSHEVFSREAIPIGLLG
jgi:hypothetical protein